jgi:hypothetical protein
VQNFSQRFDEPSKSGIYCRAALITATTLREANENSADAAKAAQEDQIKKLIFLTTL